MSRVLGSQRRSSDGLSRRELLVAGAMGALTLPQLFAAEEKPTRKQKAKHVILLYLLGGAATQDWYDLKPSAPSGVRSEFKPINTRVPGIQVCEHVPRMAKWMHKVALVRSVTHKAGCHNPLPSYTGDEQSLGNIVSTSESFPPSMGSVCEYLRQHGKGNKRAVALPDYAYLPCYLGWGQSIRRPGPYAGFLGQQYDALYTECTPSLDKGVACLPGQPQYVRGVPRLPESHGGEITLDRLKDRRRLLTQVDGKTASAEAATSRSAYDRQRSRAFQLLTSSAVRSAFDVEKERAETRDAYGRTMFGSSVLIARRLIESGVRFVNVTWDIFWERNRIDYDGWDTHTKNFSILKDWNLPQLDRAFAALMSDLSERGLLDETLILITSEMGRTPKVNGAAGRDHWTYCYGSLLAGAGIKGGSVCGASDAQAAFVKDRPVKPAELCATVYEALGIDPDMTVPDKAGRPVAIAGGAQPVREILA
jgi:hypothetical protein